MSTLGLGAKTLLRIYRMAVCLYPIRFREAHGEAMIQALRDAIDDRELPSYSLLRTLLKDLPHSLIKENLAMLRDTISRPILLYNALILAALSTVLSLGLAVIPQQVLRLGANDPQVEITGNLKAVLQQGADPLSLVAHTPVDIRESLSLFTMVFDEHGRQLASSAQLNGASPIPPAGVFDYARKHGEERVSWQPQPGVRIATVIRHVETGGFILAGRNMREVEARESLATTQAGLVWLGMLAIIGVGTFLFGWLSKGPKAVAA
jgi:hypothetical protein